MCIYSIHRPNTKNTFGRNAPDSDQTHHEIMSFFLLVKCAAEENK